MLTRAVGVVTQVSDVGDDLQELSVQTLSEAAPRRALNYPALAGRLEVGETVLLNTTAQELHLGTGGYDFVIANLSRQEEAARGEGHIVKGRYLPCQQAVLTLEEQAQYAEIWDKRLDGLPVLVGQLHSQIAPAAAALHLSGRSRVVYVMTDAAALPLAFSRLVRDLKDAGLLQATLTCGQAFGGDSETVTLHSALLAAKHILQADAVVVCQGPGNAGTGTKYGFSGIDQAQNLDMAAALGGTPIAIARMSSADARERHRGLSHHTRTSLELAYAGCLVPLPANTADMADLPERHTVVPVGNTDAALEVLASCGVRVTTMGRSMDDDPLFFRAAAAAGMPAVLERKSV